jgi:hypothetical protein
MENLIFTNSALIRANQCEKSYYLYLNYPDLRDEAPENHQSLHKRRKIIAKLTYHLFPKSKYAGIDVTGSCEMSYLHTKDLINSDTETIFNACFKYKDMFCFIDVLHRDLERWNAFEIWDNKDPNSHIVLTGTYQYFILQKKGINLGNYYSIVYKTTNNNNEGIELTYDIVSIKVQVTEYQEKINHKLSEIKKIAKQDKIPDITPGKYCTIPNKCDFYNYYKFSKNNN